MLNDPGVVRGQLSHKDAGQGNSLQFFTLWRLKIKQSTSNRDLVRRFVLGRVPLFL